MKVHLCFAGIVLLGVVAPAAAAESEADRLKQAQGLFQPLPRDMATPEAPIKVVGILGDIGASVVDGLAARCLPIGACGMSR